MSASPAAKSFAARLAFFVILPVALLAAIVIASGAAEIVLDHVLLGRAANGMPLLYTLPWARQLVAGWNLGLVYLLPVLIAVTIWQAGRTRGVAVAWLLAGGATICVIGGVHDIETVWTGIKGTSSLRLGPIFDLPVVAARIAANFALFAGAVLLSRRDDAPPP